MRGPLLNDGARPDLGWLIARPIAHRGLHDAAAGVIENSGPAAEAAIGLAILVVYFRNRGTIAVEDINMMKG